MALPEIKYCPSTLQPDFDSYSPTAQSELFGRRTRKVSPILPFAPPGKNPEMTREYNEKRKTISISGVQEKYSLLQEKDELKLTSAKGTHILKPVPTERLALVEDIPANEHTTMQIARQVYGIKTAACGMIFFNDGSPAYLTRRFDYKTDGTKYQVEDFATLMGKSPEKEGDDYKYNASYLDIAKLINRYIPAAKVEQINFFRLVVFNYLFANGDAHLKNFSAMESDHGDYLLSPAYDLMCTALHIDDSNLALDGGLYDGDMKEAPYQNFGTYTYDSFLLFSKKIGIAEGLAESILDKFMKNILPAMDMIERSFLSKEAKEEYIHIIGERHKRFKLRKPGSYS
ncbi:MAG: HipA domain-containing protein [Chitinophagaceae bacterium]|nr:HipA domain-containing protein [Chitinophagaceae bacterium]